MGIDIGTYSGKGVIVDGRGRIVCQMETAHGMENPKPGYYEQDAEAVWWHDFCLLSRGLLERSKIPASAIAAVGASTLGSDCLPVDKDLKPLRKAILYGIDARSQREMEEITAMYGEEKTLEIFGRPVCSGDVAAKILWLKNHEPEIHGRAYKFLTGSSYIAAKLTGNCVLDRFLGIASFRPFYREDGSLRPEMCAPYCRPDQLAEGRAVTDLAGAVTEKAAGETGLLPGTPVITGTGDSAAEAVSAGVLEPGDTMVQFGSSLFFYCCTDHMVRDQRVRGNSFLIPGTYSIAAGTNNAGTLQAWYRDQLFPECVRAQAQGGENAFSLMMAGIEEIPAGSDGLITVPYFAGERTPVNDPKARGVIFGLTLKHTKRHLYRSLLEGIGFSVAQHIDIFRENGVDPLRILAVGGGTKNRPWMQMVADIVGEHLCMGRVRVGASYGDALMAALGVGAVADFKALKSMIEMDDPVLPRMDEHGKYKEFRAIFEEVYGQTKGLMHQMRE